jgi:Flp pilus assembly protein TadG
MKDREQGAALVEFALVLTVLVLVLFGIVEFARAFNAQVQLTHASREGVRVHAVTGDAQKAVDATRAAATNLDQLVLSISVASCIPGEPTQVTSSYPVTYDIPFFGTATINLSSTAVMRCGG